MESLTMQKTAQRTNKNPLNKIVAALWYAWKMPERNRHQTTLERLNDPIANQALAAIEGRNEGLSAAIVAARLEGNSMVADLLNMVYAHEPAPAILRILEATKERPLPDDFFQLVPDKQPIMVYPEREPGVGEWPKQPKHIDCECGKTTVCAFYDKGLVSVGEMGNGRWRETDQQSACPGCYYKRVKTVARQLLLEMEMYGDFWLLKLASKAEFNRFINRKKYARKKGKIWVYICLPQKDGSYIVIHTIPKEGGELITSNNRTEVYNLLWPWLQTPEKNHLSTSRGFGGRYQGIRGDGRVKVAKKAGKDWGECQTFFSKSPVIDFGKALEVDVKESAKSFTKEMDTIEAYEAILKAGIKLYGRKSNTTTTKEILGLIYPNNAQSKKQHKPVNTMCVKGVNCVPDTPKQAQMASILTPPQQPERVASAMRGGAT